MLRTCFAFAAFIYVVCPVQASPMSDASPSAIAIDLAVLTASSRLAAEHSESQAVIVYAAGESAAQAAFALRPDVVASADVSIDLDTVQTGRSVAVTESQSAADAVSNDIVTATAGLAALNSLHGAAFDRLYRVLQQRALQQIADRYCRLALGSDDGVVVETARQQAGWVLSRFYKIPHSR